MDFIYKKASKIAERYFKWSMLCVMSLLCLGSWVNNNYFLRYNVLNKILD